MLQLLFTANFADGSQIIQTQEDKSQIYVPTEPEDGGKSAFFDVAEKMKTVPLQNFFLSNERYLFLVDLTDGHFETCFHPPESQTELVTVPFFFHQADKDDLDNFYDFKLIYFRSVKEHTQMHGATVVARSREVNFNLGWQAKKKELQNKKMVELTEKRIMTILV